MAADDININKKIQDSLFCNLFSDPENQYSLYRDLHPEDKDVKISDFRNVTINNIFTNQLYNDLGFTVRNKLLILVEAQSTWSVNIIVRILLYLANTLKKWIADNDIDIYSSKKINFPKPEFYVVYTGEKKKDVKDIYSLSEEFFDNDSHFIDIKVNMLKAHEDRMDIITQYIMFTRVLKKCVKEYGMTKKAVREAIRICKNKDILRKYLSQREQEVISMMELLFSQEEAFNAYVFQEKAESRAEGKAEGMAEGRAEGKAEGMAEGRAEGKAEGMAEGQIEGKALVYHEEMGLTADQIASKLGIAAEEVNAILEKNNLVSEPVHQYKPVKTEKITPRGPKI